MTMIPTGTRLPLEALLVDSMRDGLAVFDPAGQLVRRNSSARAITGSTPGQAAQRGLEALPQGVIQIREGKWADARHLQIDEGTAVLFTDVTAQVSLRDVNNRLDDLALTEAVTGLPNRRLVMGQIKRAIALAKRDLRPVGLLCIDIDGFTRLNHHLGDVVGDRILRQVGERIARSIRGSDMAARTAGDEFSVVLTAMGLPGDGSIVAVRLLLALAQPYRVAGETRTIGCSIGNAPMPRTPIASSKSRTWACVRRSSLEAVATGTARLVQILGP
jgi:diguanylate cyclase (GGDEF)-like protein